MQTRSKKPNNENTHFVIQPFYNFHDEDYQNFMLAVFKFIEPRYSEKDKIILNEHEETAEVFFINKGSVGVGFELNKKLEFVQVKKDFCIVGAYELVFGLRAMVVYKAFNESHGFAIRKPSWMRLMMDHPKFKGPLRHKTALFYDREVRQLIN